MIPVMANLYPFHPGEQVGPHASASVMWLLSLRGQGRVELPEGSWTLEPGDVLCLPFDCPRWYHADAREPFTVIGVHRATAPGLPTHRVLPPWTIRGTNVCGKTRGELRRDQSAQLRPVFERIVTWFSLPASVARTAALAAWSAVLDVEWAHLAVAVAEPDPRLGAVTSWMRLNLSNPITRADLARRAGLAESTFAAVFRDTYGMPPTQYLIALRIARAKELLATSSAAIPEIAAACGFPDLPHFARLFKRHTAHTASAYRRSRRVL